MDIEFKPLDNARRLFFTLANKHLIVETYTQEGRHGSVIALASKAAENLDINARFGVSVADRGDVEERMYAFSTKKEDTEWWFPSPFFDKWVEGKIDDYPSTVTALVEAGKQDPAIEKAFWIGTPGSHPSRNQMIYLGWKRGKDVCDFRSSDEAEFVPIVDFCKFSVLVDIQGWGFSGRLPFLLATGRPVVVIDRSFEQKFYFDGLKPWVHYIPAKESLADLVPTIKWALMNSKKTKEIGSAGQAYALEHLTQAKMVDRIAEVFTANQQKKRIKPRFVHETGHRTRQEDAGRSTGQSAQPKRQPHRPFCLPVAERRV